MSKIRKIAAALPLVCASLLFSAGWANAETVTPFGSTTGTGPWTLTSNNSFSGLEIDPTSSFTFAQLSSLSATFTDNQGGAFLGSPRFLVGLQDGANVHYVNILLGNAPNYNDTDPATFTAAYSGFNVIGNEDTGRYDTSHFAGGSPYTTYSSALAQLGDLSVVELDLVIDSGTPDRPMQLVVNSFDFAAAATSETPLPAALPLFASGLGALGFVGWRKRRKRIA